MWPALVAAGIGIMQGMKQDRANRAAMRQQAEMNRYAPLFGRAPGQLQQLSTSNALQGGLAGGMGGMQAQMNYDMMKQMMNSNNSGQPTFTTGNDLAMNTNVATNPYA